MKPVSFFVSYAHADEAFKDELLEFLSPLSRANQIKLWDDRAILVGDKWNDEIIKALEECEVILLLLSPAFLASDYINDVELVSAMESHKQNKLRIIPIMVKACDLSSHIVPNEEYKISDFQGLPKNMKPINKWELREDGWMNVINGLKPVIKLIQDKQ
ncbi:MAG: toll/interleukin-1 receptor domain-containing protein [Ginsengibacter sp.]